MTVKRGVTSIEIPEDDPEIISMVIFKDRLLVATKWHIYQQGEDGKLRPLVFETPT